MDGHIKVSTERSWQSGFTGCRPCARTRSPNAPAVWILVASATTATFAKTDARYARINAASPAIAKTCVAISAIGTTAFATAIFARIGARYGRTNAA
jgi:hypothetical protein